MTVAEGFQPRDVLRTAAKPAKLCCVAWAEMFAQQEW